MLCSSGRTRRNRRKVGGGVVTEHVVTEMEEEELQLPGKDDATQEINTMYAESEDSFSSFIMTQQSLTAGM